MKKKLIPLAIIIAILINACNLPTRPTSSPGIDQALAGTIVAMTLESLHTQVPTNSVVILNSPIPSITPTVLTTATQTHTTTPTYSIPMLNFEDNVNCREGPGKDYKVVTVIRTGQNAEVVGKLENFWVVKNPNGGGNCWIAGDLAVASGSTWALSTMTAPALPTRKPPNPPTWSKYNYNCVYAAGGSTLTMEMRWTDQANNETGYKVYRDGQLIATLAADTNTYTDIAFLESGKSFNYYIEAFSDSSQASSSIVNASCQ